MICVQIPICCSYSFSSMRGSDRPATFVNIQFVFWWKHLHALQESRFPPSIIYILHSRVIKVEDHNILRAYADELIHHIGHLGPLYHRADCDPFRVFERGDRRRTPSGCDRGRRGELRAEDIVLAHYVPARCDHASDACCDLVHEWCQVRILRGCGTDEDRFRL